MRLQARFGTCKTSCKTKEDEILTVPFPAIAEKDPSATLIFLFPAQGV